jgi:hypothetical protein
MPVTSTLGVGMAWTISNKSTQTIAVNSSGGNLIYTVPAGSDVKVVCNAITGTTASSWSYSIYAPVIQTINAQTGTSYTLVASDVNKKVTQSNASPSTITVNTDLFSAGNCVEITNIGAGACTITAGTATVSTASSLVLAQYDSGTLYFTSTGVAIWEKYQGAAGASGSTYVGASLYMSANQSISNTTDTKLSWDSEAWDTNAIHAGGSPTRMTVPASYGGKWRVSGQIVTASGSGGVEISIYVNGTRYVAGTPNFASPQLGSSRGAYVTMNLELNLSAADYVELECWQNSGGALNVFTASRFQFSYIGA